ncbi:MAG: DNA recombination protein RmuC, partial [Bacteroidota bacterium]
MEAILLYVIIAMLLIVVVLIFSNKSKNDNNNLLELEKKINDLQSGLITIERALKDDFRLNREESANVANINRQELNKAIVEFRNEMALAIQQLSKQNIEALDRNINQFNNLQREKLGQLEERQGKLVEATEKKLESIRVTVEEKLEKTLSERLGQSFDTVGRQLMEVQKGLGEMQNLAQDVGGLKRVLSNVKLRGGIGEVQLAMLLEQILAPEQYEANVKTKAGSNDLVEFAIKLPGRDDNNSQVWLPIDAKFPKDVYEQLQIAYDNGDTALIETAQKNLDNTIR